MNNCDKYELMINAFIDGELDAAESNELRAHLIECEHCKEYAAAIALIAKGLRDSEADVPEGFTESVMAKVAREDGVNLRGKPRRFVFGRYTTIAAILVVIILAAASGPVRNWLGANESGLVSGGSGNDGAVYSGEAGEPSSGFSEDAATGGDTGGNAGDSGGAGGSYAMSADVAEADENAEMESAEDALLRTEYGAPALPYSDVYYAILTISGEAPEALSGYSYETGSEGERYYFPPASVIDELWAANSGKGGWHIYREEPNTDPAEPKGIVILYG